MKYNDYELVSLAQENNEDAYLILFNKYKPLLIKKTNYYVKRFNKFNIDYDEIYSLLMTSFDSAVSGFNEENSSFYTFLLLCIERKIISFGRHLITNKYLCNFEALSFDAETVDDKNLFDIVSSFEKTPEEELTQKEEFNNLFEKIINTLSNIEVEALLYKLDGFSILEISEAMEKNVKCIYSVFRRIKDKVKLVI